MKNIFLKMSTAIIVVLPSLASADWTRSYVVEWYEPAMYYGAENGVIEPGSDCPKGSNPEIDWTEVMVNADYTREEAEWLRNPANPTRSPVHGQNQMAYRGKGRANVYIDPESYEDPGMTEVTGKIAEGIDLDGNKKTGFVSPDGKKGIDNTFYKTLGCWKTYRAPQRLSSGALQFNDSMRNGSWTVLVVLSGKGSDPMNDKNVKVGFYMSQDKLVKGGDGNVARNYTFRIQPHEKYEGLLLSARTKKGVVYTKKPGEVLIREPGYTRDLELLQAQVQLEMKEDGSLKGYLGGYRPWRPVYDGWVTARGPVIESLTWVELPSVYYALKRNADYSPEGKDGEKTHISFALRIEALPAFVMSPDAKKEVASVISYKSLAPKSDGKRRPSYVVDGIVPDRNAKVQAGPNVNVLANKAAILGE